MLKKDSTSILYEKELIKSIVFHASKSLKREVPTIIYDDKIDRIMIVSCDNQLRINLDRFHEEKLENNLFQIFFLMRYLFQNDIILGEISRELIDEERLAKWKAENTNYLLNYDELNFDHERIIDAISFAKYMWEEFNFESNHHPSLVIPCSKKLEIERRVHQFKKMKNE